MPQYPNKKKPENVKFRPDLVLKPSDKPKLRNSLMTTIINAEEMKALIREKFIRELIEKTQAYCRKNGIQPPKDNLGKMSVRKVPKHVLKELTADQMRQYVNLLKDLAATQVAAIKVLDPFDTSKSAAAIKQQSKKPAKSFEELMNREFVIEEEEEDVSDVDDVDDDDD